MNNRQSLWASAVALVVAAGAAGVWTWSLARTPQALEADSAGSLEVADPLLSCGQALRRLGAGPTGGGSGRVVVAAQRGGCPGG
jgi:hypothetical protein